VTLADGRTAYTRDGSLAIGGDGELLVGGKYGTGIVLPAGASRLVVARDGRASAAHGDALQPIGELALYRFGDGALCDIGDAVYLGGGPPERLESPQLIQGCLELSSVDPFPVLCRLLFILGDEGGTGIRNVRAKYDLVGRLIGCVLDSRRESADESCRVAGAIVAASRFLAPEY
jgi:hypothetical protein